MYIHVIYLYELGMAKRKCFRKKKNRLGRISIFMCRFDVEVSIHTLDMTFFLLDHWSYVIYQTYIKELFHLNNL